MSVQIKTTSGRGIIIGTILSMSVTVALGFFFYDFFQDNLSFIENLNNRGINITAAIGQFELMLRIILVSVVFGLVALAYTGYRQLKRLEKVRILRRYKASKGISRYCSYCGEQRRAGNKFCLGCGEYAQV